MDGPETPWEMARRHVVEDEARVARQTAPMDHFQAKGLDTARAVELLASVQDALRLMREDPVHQPQRAARHLPK